LGAEVDQVIRGAQILRGFDEDVARFLAQEMHKKGVRLHTGAHIAQVELGSTGERLVRLTDGRTLVADAVLVATGREPNTAGLGLERLGVALGSDGAVQVDSDLATNVPGLYALGDVVARLTLTPVALAEAMVLADHLFGDGQRAMSYDGIPSAVFTHPSLASVGLNESRARQQCGAVRIYPSEFRALKLTLSGSDERSLVKLIVDAQSDRVVGLHMVGADAGEVVQGFAVAMKAGATKAHFDATLGIHPTVAEEFVTLRTAHST
jgi:glutathione reductase (NADPH)